MITEDYISFETAKLLKEKGFDVPTKYFFNTNGLCCQGENSYNWNDDKDVDDVCEDYSRPSIYVAMKWLREVHNLHISIEMGFDVDNRQYFFFAPSICKFSNKTGEYQTPFGEKEFDTYEQATEAAIKYCLENLI
jgi:hypothetical protein